MKTLKIQLTPLGHYFLGGERGFGYDKQLERQMSDSYFIRSLKVPSQTTLFGALRYIIGVKEEKLREDSAAIIGEKSFDITGQNTSFGKIKSISPLYLYKSKCNSSLGQPEGYYIRTPFDHKNDEKDNVYVPLRLDKNKEIETINFPSVEAVTKTYPIDYNSKNGISHSYMCINASDHRIVKEGDIFRSSVEVVSKKNKDSNKKEEGFAKKEYIRLKEGWSFVFFADLNTEAIPEYNGSVILGKDSSVFSVNVSEDKEPDVSGVFVGRGSNFHYFQSAAYIPGGTSGLTDKADFSVLESESIRRFKTVNSKLVPEYGAPLIQLISAGSVIYSDDISQLTDEHAIIAGFNKIIDGGNKQ